LARSRIAAMNFIISSLLSTMETSVSFSSSM